MAIRKYKPTSAGRRNASVNLHVEVTKKEPERSLLEPKRSSGGRNNQGKITVKGRGGGVKRRYRKIDFKRKDRDGIAGTVVGIEYDPNRSSHIALIEYEDGVKRYIIAPRRFKDGDTVMAPWRDRDRAQARQLPADRTSRRACRCTASSSIRAAAGVLCRSAGSSARLTNKEGVVRDARDALGRDRRRCTSSVGRRSGRSGNTDHQNRRLGKAGINRKFKGVGPRRAAWR